MRLSPKETRNLLNCLKEHLSSLPYEIYLFGSRSDDQKKGGDIDLLLKVAVDDYEKVKAMKSSIKFDLEKAVGEQRVDLTIATEKTLKEDAFLISIADEMININP